MDNLLHLLRLQIEWGADEALDPNPIDRFQSAEAKPAPHLVVAEPPTGTLDLIGQVDSLTALKDAIAAFDGCALRETASNLVFAEGDPTSTTLIVGEPPGREEDRSGHPFAGPEGQLFDQMLASIRLTRGELMLTPLLPWRPPGGRPPSPGELALCLPFLHRLIILLNPARILVFGGTAARALMPPGAVRRRSSPGWVEISIPGMLQTLPGLNLPGLAEMLKNPSLRRDAWAGLRLLRRAIDQL